MEPIKTERLLLLPLSIHQLEQFIQQPKALAMSLGLEYSDFDIPEEFKSEIPDACRSHTLPKMLEHPEHQAWFTLRLIVCAADNHVIGGIGISGLPDERGEVMTGYFVDNRYAGRGFATEATAGLLRWVFSHEGVKAVIADTPKAHIASQKILQKNGFALSEETGEGNWRWRLERL